MCIATFYVYIHKFMCIHICMCMCTCLYINIVVKKHMHIIHTCFIMFVHVLMCVYDELHYINCTCSFVRSSVCVSCKPSSSPLHRLRPTVTLSLPHLWPKVLLLSPLRVRPTVTLSLPHLRPKVLLLSPLHVRPTVTLSPLQLPPKVLLLLHSMFNQQSH